MFCCPCKLGCWLYACLKLLLLSHLPVFWIKAKGPRSVKISCLFDVMKISIWQFLCRKMATDFCRPSLPSQSFPQFPQQQTNSEDFWSRWWQWWFHFFFFTPIYWGRFPFSPNIFQLGGSTVQPVARPFVESLSWQGQDFSCSLNLGQGTGWSGTSDLKKKIKKMGAFLTCPCICFYMSYKYGKMM